MLFLLFMFFFLKHRKPSALVILVNVAEILRKVDNFEKTLAACYCCVMSRHGAGADVCFALVG